MFPLNISREFKCWRCTSYTINYVWLLDVDLILSPVTGGPVADRPTSSHECPNLTELWAARTADRGPGGGGAVRSKIVAIDLPLSAIALVKTVGADWVEHCCINY